MEMLNKISVGISECDIRIIADCVEGFPKNDLAGHTRLIEKFFKTDIKPGHYTVLGFLIGYLSGAENLTETFYQNLSLCQRQN